MAKTHDWLRVALWPITICSHDMCDVTGKEVIATTTTDKLSWDEVNKKSNMLVFLLGRHKAS